MCFGHFFDLSIIRFLCHTKHYTITILLTQSFLMTKINQDRVDYNVFDIQNDFHEDRLSFPVYGEKIK